MTELIRHIFHIMPPNTYKAPMKKVTIDRNKSTKSEKNTTRTPTTKTDHHPINMTNTKCTSPRIPIPKNPNQPMLIPTKTQPKHKNRSKTTNSLQETPLPKQPNTKDEPKTSKTSKRSPKSAVQITKPSKELFRHSHLKETGLSRRMLLRTARNGTIEGIRVGKGNIKLG